MVTCGCCSLSCAGRGALSPLGRSPGLATVQACLQWLQYWCRQVLPLQLCWRARCLHRDLPQLWDDELELQLLGLSMGILGEAEPLPSPASWLLSLTCCVFSLSPGISTPQQTPEAF